MHEKGRAPPKDRPPSAESRVGLDPRPQVTREPFLPVDLSVSWFLRLTNEGLGDGVFESCVSLHAATLPNMTN